MTISESDSVMQELEKVANETQHIIKRLEKMIEKTDGWGYNQYMILREAKRLDEALNILTRIQTTLAIFRTRIETWTEFYDKKRGE